MKNNISNKLRISAFGILLCSSLMFLFQQAAMAKDLTLPDRKVPARLIPVPTDVSSQLQKNIAMPLDPLMYIEPQTIQQWREIVAKGEGVVTSSLMRSAAKLFTVDVKPEVIAGVKTHTVAPKTLPEKNRNRLLLYVHGGGYILNGGEGSIPEAMAMAHYGQIKVISIDYRMLPDHPFPAGLDDVIAVYKEVLKKYTSANTRNGYIF